MSKNYCPYCMTPVPEGESCSVCGLTSGTYIPSPHHLPPGTVLMERYLVGRVLGEGGFGITYIGCDLRLELKVAIKEYYPVDRATRNASASLEVTNFIGPSAKSFERGKQKFLGEAQVMARLDKQQVIVSVRDFFEINNTAYIVMEYIEGITFRELLEKKGGKIPAEELLPMVEPLFHALSIIHENGLIHRDISPDNLMLENGKIRLLDFGCAREASRGTETMTIALKHGYAPIEQYQQKGQGPWTDIYALSATLYYCLTGKVPPQALDRITEDELLVPSKLGIHLPSGIEQALLKGMKLQPNRRFASAEEMWRAIYAQPGKKTDSEKEEDAAVDTAAVVAPRTVMENMETDVITERQADSETETDAVQIGQESVRETASETDSDEAESATEQSDLETESDAVQLVTEQTDLDTESGAVRPVTTESDSGEESDSAQPAETWFHLDKKKRLLLGVGIAAVCLIMITAAWINHSAGEKAVKTDGQNTEADNTDPHLFDNAVRFTSGDDEEFQSLMEDDSVEAVIIGCNGFFGSRATVITKPVLLSENTFWYPENLTVAENGYLQVEGTVDMCNAAYLRMRGDVLRIYVTDKGSVWTENIFVWMDDEKCFDVAENNEYINKYMTSFIEHGVAFSETVFDKNNVYSVTDSASLQRAIEAGGPISIDADLTLEEDVAFFTPVRISEGVTVKTINKETGKWHGFLLGAGAILINNGILEGNLNVFAGGVVINNNVLGMETGGNTEYPSLWVQDESTVINFGSMDVDDCSRFWENTFFVNMGDLNCYDFYLVGGDMTNMGNVVVRGQASQGSLFEIINDSRFWNQIGGLVTVKESAYMCNDSWINNTGKIVIEHGGSFDNTVLINNGVFQVQYGAIVDSDRAGIYYGDGKFDISGADLKVYRQAPFESEYAEGLAEVTNEKELLEALEDPKIKTVYVREDISVHADLTLRKPLFIDNDCSLTMADNAALIDYGNAIILKGNASLRGNNIMLQEDAQIYMAEHANLIVDENGSLTLDSSVIYGYAHEIKLKGAVLLLKNKAGLTFNDINSLQVSDSEVILQNESVFAMPPTCDMMNISGSSITLSEEGGRSYLYTGSDMKLTDCNLRIDAGVFRNTDRNLNLSNCTITVAPDGNFTSKLSNLSLFSGTTLHNEGYVFVGGWNEHQFIVHGGIENYGTMRLAILLELSEPINNQNILYYTGSHYRQTGIEWDGAYVTGNAPIEE